MSLEWSGHNQPDEEIHHEQLTIRQIGSLVLDGLSDNVRQMRGTYKTIREKLAQPPLHDEQWSSQYLISPDSLNQSLTNTEKGEE